MGYSPYQLVQDSFYSASTVLGVNFWAPKTKIAPKPNQPLWLGDFILHPRCRMIQRWNTLEASEIQLTHQLLVGSWNLPLFTYGFYAFSWWVFAEQISSTPPSINSTSRWFCQSRLLPGKKLSPDLLGAYHVGNYLFFYKTCTRKKTLQMNMSKTL